MRCKKCGTAMERNNFIKFLLAILVCGITASSSAEKYETLSLDQGVLHMNTTDATWTYSADDVASSLAVILRGEIEDRVYVDESGKEWPYQVSHFRYNGSIVLSSRLEVSMTGQAAVSIESVHGDVEIATRLILDGYLNLLSKSGTLGGYGEQLGPGAGGLLDDGSEPPKPPGGGGHGAIGGEAFTVTRGDYDASTGRFITTKHKFGYPYLVGDGFHLLGGSAGGKREVSPHVLILPNSKGGGALEITAQRKITIGSHISANGQVGRPYDAEFITLHSFEPCGGGGSGGIIRLRAQEIEVRSDGFLSVTGGDGAINTDTGVYCGGGGAGGIIEFKIKDVVHGHLLGDHLQLDGGQGTANGGQGRVEIRMSLIDTDRDDNTSPTNPEVTQTATTYLRVDPPVCNCSEAVTTSATSVTTTVPLTCNCNETVTCPTVTSVTECDCTGTVCPTFPDTVTCNCPESTKRGVTDVADIYGTTSGDFTEIGTVTTRTTIDYITAEVTEPTLLTTNDVAKLLEESLNALDLQEENSTLEDAVLLLKAAEYIGLEIGKHLANSRQDGERVSVSGATKTVGMHVVVEDLISFNGTTFPDSSDEVFSSIRWKAPSILQEVINSSPPGTTSGDIIVVNILYTNIGTLLGVPAGQGRTTQIVNSLVVSTSVSISENSSTSLSNKVRMTAEKLQTNITGTTSCVFWNFSTSENSTGGWSTEGCFMMYDNQTHAVCLCHHLTNFALLLTPIHVEILPNDEFALEIISYIGLGLSLAALLLAFVTIAVSIRSLKNFQSAVIHLNLITALGLADGLFLIGVEDTSSEMWCRAVAIMLHYLYLATFMWMLCEGFHIYIRVTNVFADVKGYLKFYSLAGWGMPAVIVGVTAGANLQGYGTPTACWLDSAGKMLWAFVAPIGLITSLNVFFLAMIMYKFLTVKSIAKKPTYEQLKKATRAAVVLLPLLGTTWVAGLLGFALGSVVLFYAFAILNSLQGVFICIFHCVTNEDVASAVRVKLRRSRTKIDIFFTSTERKSNQKLKPGKAEGSRPQSKGFSNEKQMDARGASCSTDAPQSARWVTTSGMSNSTLL